MAGRWCLTDSVIVSHYVLRKVVCRWKSSLLESTKLLLNTFSSFTMRRSRFSVRSRLFHATRSSVTYSSTRCPSHSHLTSLPLPCSWTVQEYPSSAHSRPGPTFALNVHHETVQIVNFSWDFLVDVLLQPFLVYPYMAGFCRGLLCRAGVNMEMIIVSL